MMVAGEMGYWWLKSATSDRFYAGEMSAEGVHGGAFLVPAPRMEIQESDPFRCFKCGKFRQGLGSVSIRLDDVPPREDSAVVAGLPFHVFSTRFFQLLRPYLGGQVWCTGDVLMPDGRKSDQLVTFYSQPQVVVRGGPDSQHDVCPVCRSVYYHPVSSCYLLTHQLPLPSLAKAQLGFVVSDDLKKCIAAAKMRRLRFVRLGLEETPKDGLPEQWPNGSESGPEQ